MQFTVSRTVSDVALLFSFTRLTLTVAAEDLQRVLRDLDCIPEIRSRKHDVFAKIGKRVRSLSPDSIRCKCADAGAADLGANPGP